MTVGRPVRCVGGPLNGQTSPDYGPFMRAPRPVRRAGGFVADSTKLDHRRHDIAEYAIQRLESGELVYVSDDLKRQVLANIDAIAHLVQVLSDPG